MRNNINESLVLGTVQLGLPYGIANVLGKPDYEKAKAIVQEAWTRGMRQFDTAQAYGDSEAVLGKIINELRLKDEIRIISKIDPKLDHLDQQEIFNSVNGSLERLGVSQLEVMLLHDESKIDLWEQGLSTTMGGLINQGKIKKIGVSVYSPEKALKALHLKEIDVIQFPTNLLDHRFEDAGVFELAESLNKRIYIRSIFLQGLLLMESKKLTDKMGFAEEVLHSVEEITDTMNISKHELALGYIKEKYPNCFIVFGAESVAQVRENVVCWEKEWPKAFPPERLKEKFKDIPETMLNPTLWPKG